jgi:hypothetical protein
MPFLWFTIPAAMVALVGAVTGRAWLAILPAIFLGAAAWGGLSVAAATIFMLVAATLLVGIESFGRERRQ